MNNKKTHIEALNFCNLLNRPKPCLKVIIKLFKNFLSKIKAYYYKQWELTSLGIDDSVANIEIEESEVIGNSHKIIWMIGIISRVIDMQEFFQCLIIEEKKICTNYIKEC